MLVKAPCFLISSPLQRHCHLPLLLLTFLLCCASLPFVLPSPPHHPADFTEDQFDFHSYCIRKMTLRAYLGLLRLEDRLHHHPFYMRVSNRQQPVDAGVRMFSAHSASSVAVGAFLCVYCLGVCKGPHVDYLPCSTLALATSKTKRSSHRSRVLRLPSRHTHLIAPVPPLLMQSTHSILTCFYPSC